MQASEMIEVMHVTNELGESTWRSDLANAILYMPQSGPRPLQDLFYELMVSWRQDTSIVSSCYSAQALRAAFYYLSCKMTESIFPVVWSDMTSLVDYLPIKDGFQIERHTLFEVIRQCAIQSGMTWSESAAVRIAIWYGIALSVVIQATYAGADVVNDELEELMAGVALNVDTSARDALEAELREASTMLGNCSL